MATPLWLWGSNWGRPGGGREREEHSNDLWLSKQPSCQVLSPLCSQCRPSLPSLPPTPHRRLPFPTSWSLKSQNFSHSGTKTWLVFSLLIFEQNSTSMVWAHASRVTYRTNMSHYFPGPHTGKSQSWRALDVIAKIYIYITFNLDPSGQIKQIFYVTEWEMCMGSFCCLTSLGDHPNLTLLPQPFLRNPFQTGTKMDSKLALQCFRGVTCTCAFVSLILWGERGKNYTLWWCCHEDKWITIIC